MTVETAVFTCSICGEPSRDICISCTKDACANHRCERCKRCSDCCECDVPLSVAEAEQAQVEANSTAAEESPASAPDTSPAALPTADAWSLPSEVPMETEPPAPEPPAESNTGESRAEHPDDRPENGPGPEEPLP